VIWWVAYQRGSFHLKERYSSVRCAHARCDRLLNCTYHLRIVPDDDIEGLASLAHVLELPAMTVEPR
jgi:hypothetical protein